jgi:hypothetical protein
MLKKSASVVLASFRGPTYRSVRLASSFAAALPDSLFEHPDVMFAFAPYGTFQLSCLVSARFFSDLLFFYSYKLNPDTLHALRNM